VPALPVHVGPSAGMQSQRSVIVFSRTCQLIAGIPSQPTVLFREGIPWLAQGLIQKGPPESGGPERRGASKTYIVTRVDDSCHGISFLRSEPTVK
jgi:hypothetical protein